MYAAEIVLVLAGLALIVFDVFQIWTLLQCWTSLLIVSGHRCFYVSGYPADDLLGMSNPQILNRRGKVFLINGSEIRRLRKSDIEGWLLEDELRVTKSKLNDYDKICVVRTFNYIGSLRTGR